MYIIIKYYDYYKKTKLKCNREYILCGKLQKYKKNNVMNLAKLMQYLKRSLITNTMSYINENDDTLLSSDEDYVDSNPKFKLNKNNHTYNTTFESIILSKDVKYVQLKHQV